MEYAVRWAELAPEQSAPDKWRDLQLNTGGTHSTLQDIKLPQRAGGYWYQQFKNTRNRFIYWQTTPDAIELTEASLDVNLTGANLRCKVAAGTPPLNGISVWERPASREVVILAATVSSVHRLIFPHPDALDKKATFANGGNTSLSIFHNATSGSINSTNNYFVLPQYANTNTAVAHTCASVLRPCGEAVWALAWGRAGDSGSGGGLLVVKLPASGAPVVLHLKRESTVPRFLSNLTGALRGKGGAESLETCGVAVDGGWVFAVCGDSCLRAWSTSEGGTPVCVSQPLSINTPVRPSPAPQGHMLQKTIGSDGNLVLVSFLSFPNDSVFVVTKVQQDAKDSVRFTNICHIYGPQLELLDYTVAPGEDNNVVWALWSRPDGDTIITTSSLGAEVEWSAVAPRDPPPALPVLSSHQNYRDRLFAPGLFPAAVVKKALGIYRRTWGGIEGVVAGVVGEGDVREAATAAVQARLRHLAARGPNTDHSHLMHKCWSDLYSWCVQYMEGLQKPLGLMVSQHERVGWWSGVVRRGGVSLVRALTPLERLLISADLSHSTACDQYGENEVVSAEAWTVLSAGALWERWVSPGGADELERRLFSCAAPQHRLLPRLLHLLGAPPDDNSPTLTPQNIDDLTAKLEPIRDLQKAVLELNEALKLDVPELEVPNDEMMDAESGYESLFSSDLGVSIVTEAIRQMAQMRGRMVRGVVGALGVARGADGVPGAGHCLVHWQAFRALLWLRSATLQVHQPGASDELFRLKLSVLSAGGGSADPAADSSSGAVCMYAAGAGGTRARHYLFNARAPQLWHAALPLLAHHLAHQMWAVTGGFEFGWWMATINQPKLVQSYVGLLEPWCEWNACSRQFILGVSLLDCGDAEGAYGAFCKAAKGATSEPFLQQLIQAPTPNTTQHQALVLYYLKVIKLFEIHDAGACVVRLAETAISIANKDDPNLAMFQWMVFKWHLAGGRVERALSAAAANPSSHARANAAATLLTTLAARKQLGVLVSCSALASEAERAAIARAKLHDAHQHNPYYSYLYALHTSRGHYRKAAAVMYERATRCAGECGGARWRRRCLLAALTCLRLALPEHAFITQPASQCGDTPALVLGPDDLAKQLRDLDALQPETRHYVQPLLPESGENMDFEDLRRRLIDADGETIHNVCKRLLKSGQFLPHWLLQQYMDVDCNGCVRTLLACGRIVEAGQVCARSVASTLRTRMTAAQPAPACCPLAPLDLVRAELRAQLHDPQCKEISDELDRLIEEYLKVVSRTSEDMKLAQIRFPVAT